MHPRAVSALVINTHDSLFRLPGGRNRWWRPVALAAQRHDDVDEGEDEDEDEDGDGDDGGD
jgi:hypothetical protein